MLLNVRNHQLPGGGPSVLNKLPLPPVSLFLSFSSIHLKVQLRRLRLRILYIFVLLFELHLFILLYFFSLRLYYIFSPLRGRMYPGWTRPRSNFHSINQFNLVS